MDSILKELKFNDSGLIPVVTQDNRTDEVLMVAYMNKEAFQKSMETGMVHYWSRSRNKLWLKGETSSHFQYIKSVSYDCDGDTLLIKVEQKGAACHTGHHSCFYRKVNIEDIINPQEISVENKAVGQDKAVSIASTETEDLSSVLQEVYDVVADRKKHPKEGSYTNYLLEKGMDKILKKVGEEAAEVIIASKNKNNGEITSEISDLIYHLCVLMVERDIELGDVYKELSGRR